MSGKRDLPFRFGVEALDEMIQHPTTLQDPARIWSAAIVGPDGCGKSILGLHLVSQYVSGNASAGPLVLYVSTDLSFDQANQQWKAFGLNYPENRERVIRNAYAAVGNDEPSRFDESEAETRLSPVRPFISEEDKSIDTVFASPGAKRGGSGGCSDRQVFFMDLHRETAGDDWGFLNRLIGLLPANQAVPPLVIVDAIEGLETFVGKTDQFGQGRTRRSRVAQIARLAAQINVHLVFISEESDESVRLPEQYVADLVIRLRHVIDGDYTQRFIEIEKCRGVAHARGVHEFSIRPGAGTFTFERAPNIDDPEVEWLFDMHLGVSRGAKLAHIQVINSLHLRSRKIRESPQTALELVGSPTFRLPLFDKRISDRLLRSDLRYQQDASNPKLEVAASSGSFTALIGAPGTHKGRLSRTFLADAFRTDSTGQLASGTDA